MSHRNPATEEVDGAMAYPRAADSAPNQPRKPAALPFSRSPSICCAVCGPCESYAMPKPSPEVAERLRAYEDRCRQAGFPLTVQRRVILETMVLRDDHPTAEQIYETIRPRVPEI